MIRTIKIDQPQQDKTYRCDSCNSKPTKLYAVIIANNKTREETKFKVCPTCNKNLHAMLVVSKKFK